MARSSEILESILTHDEEFLHALIQNLIEFNLPKSDKPGISPQDFSIELDALIERHTAFIERDAENDSIYGEEMDR